MNMSTAKCLKSLVREPAGRRQIEVDVVPGIAAATSSGGVIAAFNDNADAALHIIDGLQLYDDADCRNLHLRSVGQTCYLSFP